MKSKLAAMLTTSALAGMLIACAAVEAPQLSEESIRELLTKRDEFTKQKKYEKIRQLYTSNVTIRISYMGTEEEVNATEYFSAYTNEEVEVLNTTTTPKNIEIAEDGRSARIDCEVQNRIIMEAEGDQATSFFQDETLTVTNTGNALNISSVHFTYKYIPEANELYRRVMTRLKEEGQIDKETAIAWLEEAGCSYQKGDGKRKQTSVSSKNNFNAGDEIAILASQIPGVQLLWLNGLSDGALEYIGRMSDLEGLMVMRSDVTDAGVAKLAACTNLSVLSLTSPNLTDKALETIAALPKISRLNFSLVPGTGEGLVHLSQATELEYLMLYNVSVEDLKFVENIPNLKTVMINGSDSISDKDLFHFENMKQLKALSLYNTKATYAGVKQLKEKRPELYIGPDWLANPCKSSLRRIERAKKTWAEKNEKKTGSRPAPEDIDPYLKSFGGWDVMNCQNDGTLSINPVGEGASCSIHGAGRASRPSPKGLSKEDFDTEGAVVGRWTMDVEAAKKMASEKQLPILLNFTGSDWCGWCKLMEKNVFTKPDWKSYAGEHIVMVLIDFPRDKTAVPEKYKARNKSLKDQYGISGYPTFVLLAPDGTTEIARLKAGRNKTPESFIKEITGALDNK